MKEEVKQYVEELIKSKLSTNAEVKKNEEQPVHSDKELDGLFKSDFKLGATLEQTTWGNAIVNTRKHAPNVDLEKAYTGSPRAIKKKALTKNEVEDFIKKSLFNNEVSTVQLAAPTKEDKKNAIRSDIEWMVRRCKELKDMSWLIESNFPELKDMFESSYSKLEKDITKKYEEYKKVS